MKIILGVLLTLSAFSYDGGELPVDLSTLDQELVKDCQDNYVPTSLIPECVDLLEDPPYGQVHAEGCLSVGGAAAVTCMKGQGLL